MVIEKALTERRKFVRIHSDFPVQLKQVPQQYPVCIHNSISQDISEGGLKLSSFYFYPVNCRILMEVFLSYDTEPVRTVGRVVWIEQIPYQDRYKVGIEFSDLNEDHRLRLQQMVEEKTDKN